MDEIQVEYIEFDLNDFLRMAMFPKGYDRSDIEALEVDINLPPFLTLGEDMINLSMLEEGGHRIKDSVPYLVKDGKWWIADMDDDSTDIIIQYGDEKQQRGVKRIPYESLEEAMKSLNERITKKFQEGYQMSKRRRIYWEKIDD